MKNILTLLCLLLLPAVTSAQKHDPTQFQNNWNIGIAGGTNLYMGNDDNKGDFVKRLAPVMDISLTRWSNPYVGLRLLGSWGQAQGWATRQTENSIRKVGDLYFEKFNLATGQIDFLVNMSSLFFRYNPQRVWNLSTFFGGGGAYSWGVKESASEMLLNVGVLNTFRVSSRIDFMVEGRYGHTRTRVDRDFEEKGSDYLATVTAGLIFKLGKQSAEQREKRVKRSVYDAVYNAPQTVVKVPEAAPVVQVQEPTQIQAQVPVQTPVQAQTPVQPVQPVVPAQPVQAVVETPQAPTFISGEPVIVLFGSGRYLLDAKALAQLDEEVKNTLQYLRDKTLTLSGTADREIGGAERNEVLSKLRVDVVFDILVDKYGFDPQKLIKKPLGDKDRRFERAEQNRCVIIEW